MPRGRGGRRLDCRYGRGLPPQVGFRRTSTRRPYPSSVNDPGQPLYGLANYHSSCSTAKGLSQMNWADDEPHYTSADGPRIALLAAELPEVVKLVADGWNLLPESPVWAFLPAVWPRSRRTWVKDRSTRYQSVVDEKGTRSIPWFESDYADLDVDTKQMLATSGIQGWRPSRLWLLQDSNGEALSLVVRRLQTDARSAGVPVALAPDLVEFARGWVQRRMEDRSL